MGERQVIDIPSPQGNYRIAKRHGDIVYTSGMTPRLNGVLTHTGSVAAGDNLDDLRAAVELAASNALKAVRSILSHGEDISEVLTMTVFVAASPEFQHHSRVADHASNFVMRELGEHAAGARAAVGVSSLPGGAVVEIQLTAVVR